MIKSINKEQMADRVDKHILKLHGSYKAAAEHYKVSRQFVSAVINCHKQPTEQMLKDLGYEKQRRLVYVKKDKA